MIAAYPLWRPARAERSSPAWLGTAGRAACLAVLTCLCYLPALRGPFLWDDQVMVSANPLLRSAAGLRAIWWSTQPVDYFPLTSTSFWLEWRLWGANPLGYHVVNLALHLASAGLLWRLLRAVGLPGAWFGALLFALHPVNVASVGWIAERKNVLSMVFYLACLGSYVRSENLPAGDKGRWRWYGLALGCYVLAALSKSSVVMLPFVLWLLAWWRRGRVSWGEAARSGPFFAVSLALGSATIWFQHHRSMTPGFLSAAQPPLWRLLLSGYAILFYLGKALLPLRLSMLYPGWEISVTSPWSYAPLLTVAALLWAAWRGRARWGRGPAAVLGYFVLTLLPVAGWFHMSFFEYSYVSDHLAYLALLGPLAGTAALLGKWYEHGGVHARAALITMTLLAGLLGAGCLQRADEFGSDERLWRDTLEIAPNSAAAHNSLGCILLRQRKLLLAEAHFRRALRLEPRSYNAACNLAEVLRLQGRWQESAAVYRAVLRLQPNAACYNNLGVVLLESGHAVEARGEFQQALALAPGLGLAHFNLYRAAVAGKNTPAAAAELRACLRLDPGDVEAREALANLGRETDPSLSGTAIFGSDASAGEKP